MLEYLSLYKTKLCVFFLLWSSFVILLLYGNQYYGQFYFIPELYPFFNASDYVVSSSKCKIPNLPAFNRDSVRFHSPQKYTSCSEHPLLSYITKKDDKSYWLNINQTVAPLYSANGVSCCYAIITRHFSPTSPDDDINMSPCIPIKGNSAEIYYYHFVMIKCLDRLKKKIVYENVHSKITILSDIRQKLDQSKNTTNRPISVLIVSIDSVSRLNFIRSLPKTYAFLRRNDWTVLKGYNKIGLNTFPNFMGILTGYNDSTAFDKCNPRDLGQLDKCPLVWYDYRKLGYVTGYAEDAPSISTFSYLGKKGFIKPPTDFYFRPYMLMSEKFKTTRLGGMDYCTGPEQDGERVLNIALDFVDTFRSDPHFAVFWMNSFSHSDLNAPSGMDGRLLEFVEKITRMLDNTVIFLLSDHGIRFGPIRWTQTGWLEERLPFISISVPKTFKEKYRLEYQNLQRNVHKFTNTFDLHMTLQHILQLSGYNRTIIPSESCPKCLSLFQDIDNERSCEDSGIEDSFCACTSFSDIATSKEGLVDQISRFILAQVQSIIDRQPNDKCAKYSLNRVLSARVSRKNYRKTTYYLLLIETQPKAIFEATIIDGNELKLIGGISRVDEYGSHGKCTNDSYLKMYCYCE